MHKHCRKTNQLPSSKSLSNPESCYTQIEIKMLSNVHVCTHLEWYGITVKYRKGNDMELCNALYRAQLALTMPEFNDLKCSFMISYISVSD